MALLKMIAGDISGYYGFGREVMVLSRSGGGRGRMEIDALIPAYNEARSIGGTVAALLRLSQVRRVLVIDDGSGDDTAARAALAGRR